MPSTRIPPITVCRTPWGDDGYLYVYRREDRRHHRRALSDCGCAWMTTPLSAGAPDPFVEAR